jgi:hypothetical protein
MSDSIFFAFIPSDDLDLVSDVNREISDVTATEIHTDATTKRESMIFVIDAISLTSETWKSFVIADRKRSESSWIVCLPRETIACSFSRL